VSQGYSLQGYLQILSDINRLKIIQFIAYDEKTVSEIVNQTKLSQPLVSHHLKVLKNYTILDTKRNGPFILYKLHNTDLLDILGLLCALISKDNELEDPMFIPSQKRKDKKDV